MRNPKTRLTLVLAAVVLSAWAGNTVVTRKARANKNDRSDVAQVQPAREDEKPGRATESRPKEARAPENRSDGAQGSKSERNVQKAREYKSAEVQAPTRSERREPRVVADPTPAVRAGSRGETSGRSGDADVYNIPQSIGEPSGPRGGRPGGYKGGYGHDHFHRRPKYFPGLRGWHGRREQWRYRHFHGSWHFLFYLGPRIYYPPVHYPHIIRIPRNRVGVYVRYTGEDQVGSLFANSVRERLREEGLRVVYSPDDARLELYIISMEQDPEDPGYGSSISVSYVWYPGHKFITAQMVDAGLNEVDDLAASVAGFADELVDDYR